MTFGILDLIVNVSVIFGEYIDLRIFSFKNHQKITFILIHSFSKKEVKPHNTSKYKKDICYKL